MATPESVGWDVCERCANQGGIGVRLPSGGKCWSHADEPGLDAALNRLGDDGRIDARGVTITSELLRRILAAARNAEGRPAFKEALFDRASFTGPALFRGVRFEGSASFKEAQFSGEVNFRGAQFSGVGTFNDARFDGLAGFRGAQFASNARFLGTRFGGAASFRGTQFGGYATFHGAQFDGWAGFNGPQFQTVDFTRTRFNRGLEFSGVQVAKDAGFVEAQLPAARQLGPLCAQQLTLDRATFGGSIVIEAATAWLSCVDTRFEGEAVMRLRFADVVADAAIFSRPSSITYAEAPLAPEPRRGVVLNPERILDEAPLRQQGLEQRPRLRSLRRVDTSTLVLVNLDLSRCQFHGAHNLDRLRVEGLEAFTGTPGFQAGWAWPPVWRWTRRQALAEEHAWRAAHERGIRRRGWHGAESHTAQERLRRRQAARPRQRQAREVANLYRALRKGREDAKDEPGAADFYYGEMEMRRKATPAFSAEQIVLTLYWLLAGYALRAWRACAALAVVLVIVPWLLVHRHGLADPQAMTFWSALRYSGRTAIGLLPMPKDQPTLTPWGDILQISVRVLVPVLLGLAVLSIRGRVKR